MKLAKTTKILAVVMAFLVVATLAVVGTFAWYTFQTDTAVSTINVAVQFKGDETPILVSLDGEEWTTELHSEDFINAAHVVLRPVSTNDLVHWYLPVYDLDGNIEYFYLKDVVTSTVKDDGTADYSSGRLESIGKYINDGGDAAESVEDDGTTYVAYFDLYMKSQDTTGQTYSVRLNNPARTADGTYNIMSHETVHGTYVLSLPRYDTDTSSYTGLEDGGSLAARVGFQVYDLTTENGKTIASETNMMIYEPNANQRNTDLYVNGETASESDIRYIQGTTRETITRIRDYKNFELNGLYPANVPIYDETKGIGYHIGEQETEKQTLSSWSDLAVNLLDHDDTELTPLGLTSRAVETFGVFLTTGEGDPGGVELTYHTSPTDIVYRETNDFRELTTLTLGELKQVRIYIWIEGQDIDCWNQIAGDGIVVNLEFRGDVIE